MKPLAEPAFTLPAGIAPSDLAFISQYVAIIAAVFAVLGILLLKRFAGRSISFMVAIVVAVCTLTSMAGVGVIAYRMVGTPSVRDEVLDLMAIAGLAGLVVALFVGRRLTKASRALSSAVQDRSPPRTSGWPRPGPGSGRSRPAGASSSPGSAMTCAPRWPACAPWPRRWKTR